MVFSSIPFIFIFLPCVIVLYLLAPRKLKNTVLLLVSLVFYGWGEPAYVFLMLGTIFVNYLCGIMIEKSERKIAKNVFLLISLMFSLGMLGYFKYADFFIENFNRATGLSVSLLNIALPVGISFYTFQILSYTIDVRRGEVPAQKNIINLGAYVTLFPQLVAGPIVRYSDISAQLETRKHTWEKTSVGIRRFVFGFAKKILLANTLGELCDSFISTSDKSVLFYWLYIITYMLQIYFDFSGYSDMAIGLGKIFGFEFLENFRYPFISKSASEFWRRWHISLGSWFRDYVYIPMGGNRVPKFRLLINIFTVWLLTGLWHGAEWNFVLWGIYFAVVLLLEKYFLLKYLEKSAILSRIYAFFVISVSFGIFCGADLNGVGTVLSGMFGSSGIPLVSQSFLYSLKNYAVLLVIAATGATPLPALAVKKLIKTPFAEKVADVLEIVFLVCLFVVSTAFLADGSFNPFLYFRF